MAPSQMCQESGDKPDQMCCRIMYEKSQVNSTQYKTNVDFEF